MSCGRCLRLSIGTGPRVRWKSSTTIPPPAQVACDAELLGVYADALGQQVDALCARARSAFDACERLGTGVAPEWVRYCEGKRAACVRQAPTAPLRPATDRQCRQLQRRSDRADEGGDPRSSGIFGVLRAAP